MRVLEGWLWGFHLTLHACDLVLLSDLGDRDSPLLLAHLTGSCSIDSTSESEKMSIQLQHLTLTPAVLDPSQPWFHPPGLPPLLPTGLHETARGLRLSPKPLLEPLTADASHAFEKGRVSDLLLAPRAPPPLSTRRQPSSEGEGESPELELPRLVRVLVREIRLARVPPSLQGLLTQSGVTLRVNGQAQSGLAFGQRSSSSWLQGLDGSGGASEGSDRNGDPGERTGAPDVDHGLLHMGREFAFAYSGRSPDVRLEVGEALYVPAGEWAPQLSASFSVHDDDPDTSGSPR